jgi:hypothetical protein
MSISLHYCSAGVASARPGSVGEKTGPFNFACRQIPGDAFSTHECGVLYVYDTHVQRTLHAFPPAQDVRTGAVNVSAISGAFTPSLSAPENYCSCTGCNTPQGVGSCQNGPISMRSHHHREDPEIPTSSRGSRLQMQASGAERTHTMHTKDPNTAPGCCNVCQRGA